MLYDEMMARCTVAEKFVAYHCGELVDEFSYLFSGRINSELRAQGWLKFAEEASEVQQWHHLGVQRGWSKPGGYTTTFHFLRHDDYPWRLELLEFGRLHTGSPVHDARLWGEAANWPVHASWKDARLAQGDDAIGAALKVVPRDAVPVQVCSSDYGRYVYCWDGRLPTLLKPRVNLRDTEAAE